MLLGPVVFFVSFFASDDPWSASPISLPVPSAKSCKFFFIESLHGKEGAHIVRLTLNILDIYVFLANKSMMK